MSSIGEGSSVGRTSPGGVASLFGDNSADSGKVEGVLPQQAEPAVTMKVPKSIARGDIDDRISPTAENATPIAHMKVPKEHRSSIIAAVQSVMAEKL